jgi:4-hydroxy-3-polyprenylbenzoate decarboxylase
MESFHRVVVAITGASGAVYGHRLLEVLAERPDVETHLVASSAGWATVSHELDVTPDEMRALADVVHRPAEIGATIASGSFQTAGMIVAPCSIKTLSAVANSYSADLVSRAADVTLKERRPLVLLVRETPFHVGHLRLMLAAAEAGAVIAPPVPAFYQRPSSLRDVVDHTVYRALAHLGLPDVPVDPWKGLGGTPQAE